MGALKIMNNSETEFLMESGFNLKQLVVTTLNTIQFYNVPFIIINLQGIL